MGRYKTVVGSSTMPLIEDTPDVIKQSVLSSVVNGTNIATDLMNTLTNTYSHKVRRAYQYASKTYYAGLPEGTIGRFTIDTELVKTVLKKFVTLGVDEDIIIVTTAINNVDGINFAKEHYRNDSVINFDPAVGVIPNVEFQQYYNTDGVLVTPDNNKIADARIRGAEIVSDTQIRIELYFEEQDPDPDLHRIYKTWVKWETVTISNTTYNRVYNDLNQYYYYTEYYIIDTKTNTRKGFNWVWNYWEGSHYYPELDQNPDVIGKTYYMPVIPIRVSNKMLTDPADSDTTRYKTSKELLHILGLDIEQLHEGVSSNPDIDAVDHAYVILGIDLFTEKPESWRYIHEYVKYLYTVGTEKEVLIEDLTYKVKLSWDKITFERKSGIIGKVGEVTKKVIHDTATDERYVLTRKQETSDTYHEFKWYDVTLHNYIYQTMKNVTTTLDAKDTDAEEALVIPINISIVENNLTAIQANTVYYDALRIVFNSYERKKLKWYQTGLFRFVVMVIAVAISAVTYGAGAAFVSALLGVFINKALELIYELVVQVFGDEAAPYVMAAIIIVAIYFGYTYGFIPDIGQVVNLAINTASYVLTKVQALEYEDIMQEYMEFQEQAEDKLSTLEELEASMSKANQIDPLGVFSNVGMIPGQSIDQFYYSKLQLPIDYGTASYDMLHNWVDNQLQLPQLMR